MRAYISAKNNINVLEVLEELKDNISNLPQDVEQFAKKIFFSPQVRTFIIEANQRLLSQGLRPDLTPIEKEPTENQESNFYERYTIYNRREGMSGYKAGSQTQFVDLYKTGFFYKSLEVKAGSKELLEFSTDPKSLELEAIWGDILGISSEDILELVNMLRPQLVKFVNDRLKIK